MKYLQLIILFLFMNLPIISQIFPDGNRYLDEVFDSVDVVENIVYGSNISIGDNNIQLLMDIWQPANDTTSLRPLIVVAHGGAFVQGQPSDMDELCETFAKRGYVVSNISYRLYDKAVVGDSLLYYESIMMAVQDMRAAIRFMKHSAYLGNLYKIDTNTVFACGASAGAVMSVHAGYLDPGDDVPDYILTLINKNGGFEGTSSDSTLMHSSQVQGILNYSGALLRDEFVDNNFVPIYSAHDDNDPIVKYGAGSQATVLGFTIHIEGSYAIHQHAELNGIPNQLFTVENSFGHVSYFESNYDLYADSVINESAQFLYNVMFPDTDVDSDEIREGVNEFMLAQNYPNPFNPVTTISFNLHKEGFTRLEVFSSIGERVEVITNEFLSAGTHTFNFNAANFASGVYFYRLTSGSFVEAKKMILMK